MTDALADLSAQGVSIWLDDISRERLRTGNLQDLVDDKHVVGVTSNPTIFQKALEKGDAYDEQMRDLAVRGVALDEAVRLADELRHPLGLRRAAPGLRPHRRRGRPGVDRGRPAHRPRHRADHRRGQGAVVAGRPAQRADQDPGDGARASPSITAATAAGISVNVTLIFGLDRYDEVMDAYLTGLEQAQGRRHRPVDDPLGRVVLRLPRRHRDRQAAGQDRHRRGAGAARQGRHRQRAAGLRALREGLRLRPLEGARGGRREHAAAAVGLDRRQGPGLRRHDVRRRAGRAGHGQHDAGGHPRRGRRPRRDPRRRDRGHLRRRPARSSTISPQSASTTTTSSRCSRPRACRSSRTPGRSCSKSVQAQLDAARPA